MSLPQLDPSLWALDTYNSGFQALEMNDLARAEQKLLVAAASVRENVETNFALGNLRLAQGRRAEATRYYEATLGFRPDQSGALNNLGLISLEAGDLPAAERFFRAALAHEPESAKTHYLLAKTLFQAGEPEAALEEISRALRIAPAPQFEALRQEISRRISPGMR